MSCSHEIALQQRAKVVIEGIISNYWFWLAKKLIAFLVNQNGRKYQNKLKKSDFWESWVEVLTGLNFDIVSGYNKSTSNNRANLSTDILFLY